MNNIFLVICLSSVFVINKILAWLFKVMVFCLLSFIFTFRKFVKQGLVISLQQCPLLVRSVATWLICNLEVNCFTQHITVDHADIYTKVKLFCCTFHVSRWRQEELQQGMRPLTNKKGVWAPDDITKGRFLERSVTPQMRCSTSICIWWWWRWRSWRWCTGRRAGGRWRCRSSASPGTFCSLGSDRPSGGEWPWGLCSGSSVHPAPTLERRSSPEPSHPRCSEERCWRWCWWLVLSSWLGENHDLFKFHSL